MKLANVTLPLLVALSFSGSGAAIASSGSALDPYAYIKAPSRAEREEAIIKKTKKFKIKTLKANKEKATEEVAPVAKATPSKPATVILSTDTPKPSEKVSKEKAADVKTASNDDGGFMSGIKQSTGGIAKSTKAVGSSMVNGTKSVGTKIAEGFKSAGEKVKDSTAGVGEKVKEGGSSVGGKVASGFKTAGGSLAAIPKAMGSAASKVGASTGDGAKKLAAAPVAGFGAMGRGINKLNPFHGKEETPVAVANKSKGKSTEGATEAAAEKTASATEAADSKTEDAKQKVAEKTEVAVKVADKNEKSEGGGIKGKLASANKAGLDVTKAGVGAISHGFGKLNPFHKGGKSDAVATPATAQKPVETKEEKEAPATAAKPVEQTPQQDDVQQPQEKLGERINPEAETQQMAAPEGAVPQ